MFFAFKMHGCNTNLYTREQTRTQLETRLEKNDISRVCERNVGNNSPGSSKVTSHKLVDLHSQSQRIKSSDRQCESFCESIEQSSCYLPFSQAVFLNQLAIIFFLDAFCLLKFITSPTEASTKQSREINDNSCHDTSVYMSILSSTLAYLIPAPRVPVKIQSEKRQRTLKISFNQLTKRTELTAKYFSSPQQRQDQQSNKAILGKIEVHAVATTSVALSIEPDTQTESVDYPDYSYLPESNAPINPYSKSKDGANPSYSINFDVEEDYDILHCFNWQVSQTFFICFSQMFFVICLVLFSVSRMLLVFSLTCEERTAHFMILSTCIAYLLPNVDNFNRSNKR